MKVQWQVMTFVAPCSIVQGFKVSNADEGAVQRSEFNGLFRYQPFADFLGI
jgi:hypothetical protein